MMRMGRGSGLLDGGARLGMKYESQINRRDGDEMRWVYQAEFRTICVVDDEPFGVLNGSRLQTQVAEDAPGHL